ncbi:MAG: hypothetical protein KBT00_05135 [Bacteroidales bacterium]|nr:hypothetical protein [Candidatus Cacconaster merdequi]
MDAVITFVDGQDPLWQQDYHNTTGKPILAKRFRDWGTLKYLLRGIEKNMPFVRNVYLVVARESQVPQWADRNHLKVVLHQDIIPQKYLPVFNSAAIEMFLHRIPGLDDRYVYFNDDIFPVMPCSEDDFYSDGRLTTGFSRHIIAGSLFKKQVRQSDRIARKAAGLKPSIFFIRPQHICTPMLKQDCYKLSEIAANEIDASISPLRRPCNLNQHLFLNYSFHCGHAISRRISRKHFSLSVATPEKIERFLNAPDRKIVCINDVEMSTEKFEAFRGTLLHCFDKLFPEKSRFEL